METGSNSYSLFLYQCHLLSFQVLGIALEARKLDIIKDILDKNEDGSLKNYLLDVGFKSFT
ncbi:hypothetical protein PCK2_000416 [Pneumocystis canis]|nr:hypothetical protein PCK2_000416 [Pneumocystis canis]